VSDARPLPGPLTGLRILELADEKGQFCGKLLGDLGADVVKIEPPGGEPGRYVGPFLDDIPHPERSLSFWYYNTSKRGITLNLETADGHRLFGRLAATSDVILETFRPGFLASLELDYESLRKQNSRLIMCDGASAATFIDEDHRQSGVGGSPQWRVMRPASRRPQSWNAHDLSRRRLRRQPVLPA
jgi:crotonobetainyl-CoA:carnitine CoA-transferase CaiB-like acyl-CoA transferase